jgi:hypothetical protein
MSKRLPLTDFRAVRHKLEPHEFAISEGMEVAPTDLIDEETWAGITHLPDDVAIRTSDHNGVRLELLYSLWGDWITATGDPEKPDELFNCMLDAADSFQCTNFLFLHGYYRATIAELRVALELVMIGACGNLRPDDPDYILWKTSGSELGFTRFRKRMYGTLRGDQCKWLLADDAFPAKTFQQLCNFTHSFIGSAARVREHEIVEMIGKMMLAAMLGRTAFSREWREAISALREAWHATKELGREMVDEHEGER